MKSKNTLWHRIVLAVFTVSLIIGNLAIFMPTALAAQTSTITAANFLATDAKKFLVVYFSEPVCADVDCTLDLNMGNFEYYDGSSSGFTAISATNHTAGADWVQLTMDANSVAGDTSDKIKVKDVYTTGGMLLSDPSAGTGSHSAWVSLTQDTTPPTITTKGIVKDGTKDSLLLGFSEPVNDESANALALADFAYTDQSTDGAASLDASTESADLRWLTLSTNASIIANDATDAGDDHFTIVDNQVYDLVGNEMVVPDPGVDLVELSSFTVDSTSPTIQSAYGQIGNDTNGGNDIIIVEYDEPVFSVNDGTGALVAADFTYNGAESISLGTHDGGTDVVFLDLSANLTSFNTVQAADGASVYDAFGNAATTAQTTVDDNTYPIIRSVMVNQWIDHAETAGTVIGDGTCDIGQLTTEDGDAPSEGGLLVYWTDAGVSAGTEGCMINLGEVIYDTSNGVAEYTQVKFDLYYEDNSGAVNFTDDDDLAFVINDAANFTTAAEWDITTDLNEKTWTEVTIDLTSAVSEGTALSAQTNPQYFGIVADGTTQFANDDILNIDNIRFSRGAASKSNQLIIEYSESIDATGDPAEGATQASTSTFGDMTTNRTVASLGAFAAGTFTTKTGTNNITKSTDGKRVTIELASLAGGLITQASPVTLTGLFTPTASISDIDGNSLEVTSSHTPETIIDALDLTSAANPVTNLSISDISGDTANLAWTASAQTAATFSHYAALYDTSSGIDAADSVSDETDDANLATATTSSTSVTGLTGGSAYYFNLVGVDTKGNASTLATETNISTGGGGGNNVGPKAPSSFTATVDENMHVVLTWTDPTDADLERIHVIRSKGAGVDPSSLVAQIVASPSGDTAETYLDEDITEGEVVNYYLRPVDNNGNYGTNTETISLTIEVGAEEVAEDIVEEETEEEAAAEEEATLPEGEGFTDTDEHWAEAEILGMAGVGIATGHPDGSFAPDGNLNRAEAAALLYRVLGFDDPEAPDVIPFSDVPVDVWYAGYVSNMKDLDMIHGYGDGTYGPENNIARAEFIKIALEVYYYITTDEGIRSQIDDWMGGVKTTAYRDLEDSWYTQYVTTAHNMGWIHGYKCDPGRCFGAEDEITRAEATVILYNMFYSYFTAVIIEEIVEEPAE